MAWEPAGGRVQLLLLLRLRPRLRRRLRSDDSDEMWSKQWDLTDGKRGFHGNL